MTPSLIAAFGLFLIGLAAVVYVSFRFLTLLLSMDMAMLREFKGQSKQVTTTEGVLRSKVDEYLKNNLGPSDGEYVPYTDEAAFVQEECEKLKAQGLDSGELEELIKKSVSAEV